MKEKTEVWRKTPVRLEGRRKFTHVEPSTAGTKTRALWDQGKLLFPKLHNKFKLVRERIEMFNFSECHLSSQLLSDLTGRVFTAFNYFQVL